HQVVEKQERIMKLARDMSMRTNRRNLDRANLAELSESYNVTDEPADVAAAGGSTSCTVARGHAGAGTSHAPKPRPRERPGAGEARATGEGQLCTKAGRVRAKAEKQLEQFKKDRAKDPTAKEIKGDQREQAWLYHAADALLPDGATRNATMGHLANSREKVA